jgi:hypothetical protein
MHAVTAALRAATRLSELAKVKLLPVTQYHKMIVDMVFIQMCCYYNLEPRAPQFPR